MANFHTHPLKSANNNPSGADMDNNWRRQIPGMVISRGGIYAYNTVLKERETKTKPIQYPGNKTDGGTFNYEIVKTPCWSLANAPNQDDTEKK